jgi:glycosyltransferase involved in cell wall biosynthesis
MKMGRSAVRPPLFITGNSCPKACELPCIAADYGGIGEYVTTETGFKIEPRSRDFPIQGVAQAIRTLLHQPKLYTEISQGVQRAEQLRWQTKAEGPIKIYHRLLLQKQASQ